VKGNKKVKHELPNWEHPADSGYYYINIDDYKKAHHELIVEGEIGDYISIGSLLYQKNSLEYISVNKFICNGFEVTGYIRPNEKFSYVHDEKMNNLALPYSLNNNYYKIKYNKNLGYGVNSYIEQLSTEEDSFFSFQFMNNTKYDGEGNNKYMPQLIGVDYPRLIKEGTTIGLIPVKPSDNFNSIIYETLLLNGEIKVAVFDCLNYPLCKTDDINNNIKSEIINEKYKSSVIIISRDEFKNISPITKKQKMLLIKCIKGTKIDDFERVCKLISSMRVDKEIIYDNDIYKFIEKDEENNFIIPKNGEKIYLNIEIISGNILIRANATDEYYQNGNKRLYIFRR
jgi:hypothetical protein